MNSTLFSVRASTPVSSGIRSRATKTCTPLDGTMRCVEVAPASSRTRSVHGPAAQATCRARSVSGSPVSSSAAPTTPSRIPVTRTRVATCAPWATAVRATLTTTRASSEIASWNCTPPANPGRSASGRRRRWRWRGTERAPPIVS